MKMSHSEKAEVKGAAAGLTRKAMKQIQCHYGRAISSTTDDMGKMKRSDSSLEASCDCGDWCSGHSGDLENASRTLCPCVC